MAQILLVEDDASLAFLVQDNLMEAGYEVVLAADGMQALTLLRTQKFILVLLDVNLPLIDGFSVLNELRSFDAITPVLLLTAKHETQDKLQAFKLGGDDYITKPFAMEELLLRIAVFLRRSNTTKPQDLSTKNFYFKYKELSLEIGQTCHKLTQKEADVLQLLLLSANQIVKREELLMKGWGKNDYFLGRSLDVFISRLRKYLQAVPSVSIENIHGIGFRLNLDAQANTTTTP